MSDRDNILTIVSEAVKDITARYELPEDAEKMREMGYAIDVEPAENGLPLEEQTNIKVKLYHLEATLEIRIDKGDDDEESES